MERNLIRAKLVFRKKIKVVKLCRIADERLKSMSNFRKLIFENFPELGEMVKASGISDAAATLLTVHHYNCVGDKVTVENDMDLEMATEYRTTERPSYYDLQFEIDVIPRGSMVAAPQTSEKSSKMRDGKELDRNLPVKECQSKVHDWVELKRGSQGDGKELDPNLPVEKCQSKVHWGELKKVSREDGKELDSNLPVEKCQSKVHLGEVRKGSWRDGKELARNLPTRICQSEVHWGQLRKSSQRFGKDLDRNFPVKGCPLKVNWQEVILILHHT